MPTNPSPSQLSPHQIFQRAFEESEDRLRVDAVVTATIGDVTIEAATSDIAIKDRASGNLLKVNADGSIDANTTITAVGGDSIAISDGTYTATVNVNGGLNVAIEGLTAFKTSQVTVGTSAVQITPTPLTGRSSISVKNLTLSLVYIGNSNTVTSSTGWPLQTGESIQFDIGATQPIWAISSSASQTVAIFEIG